MTADETPNLYTSESMSRKTEPPERGLAWILTDAAGTYEAARGWLSDVHATFDDEAARDNATKAAAAIDDAADALHTFDNNIRGGIPRLVTTDADGNRRPTFVRETPPVEVHDDVRSALREGALDSVIGLRETTDHVRGLQRDAGDDVGVAAALTDAASAFEQAARHTDAFYTATAADHAADLSDYAETGQRPEPATGATTETPPAATTTAAPFADSTNELLAVAEDVQQRTHGWVDAVGQVHGRGSDHYRQAAAATDGVDHTVGSLRHAARDFALVDNPAADDTPAQVAPTVPGGDDRSPDLADETPDRDELAAVGASVAADLDELAFALTSLRDEAADWRHAGAVAEASHDLRRLEHAQNAGSELDDAVQAAHHGSWQVGDVTENLLGADANGQHTEQSTQQRLAGLVADLGDIENRLYERLDEPAAARIGSDLQRAQHSLAWAAVELGEADTENQQAYLSGSDAARQRIQGPVMGPNGQISDQEFVLRATDDPTIGGSSGPFELTEPNARLDESLAAAENGLNEIRAAQAAESQREADVARWHSADRQVEAERSRDSGRAIAADSEPPF